MNKEKRILINKKNAMRLLTVLFKENCWDPFDTRFKTTVQCTNTLRKAIEEYFSLGDSILIYWNKNSYDKIFEDKELLDMLVYLMKEYNYHKELELETIENN